MVTLADYRGQKPEWCPGCGNFGILTAFKRAMFELGVEPHEFVIVSGIGQSGKFPHYTRCNAFNGLHGRTLPVATGVRLANHEMPVWAFAGDGDCYGEGGNHWLHAMRRNIGVKLVVHDNQVYGLTKGQASPTSMKGMDTSSQPFGVITDSLDPLAVAVAMECSLVARGFSADTDQLVELFKTVWHHDGFALLDILQPCVTWNKLNTYEWYRERCYHVEPGYDPTDPLAAMERAREFGEGIPTGVIYRNERRPYERNVPVLAGMPPLVKREQGPRGLELTVREFY
jgi:2-oxoglutarate/2-oxoacid ferredoxin oxidoreductase subunit beta